jgi:cyclopropane fatty-acyl-phospholipid synthase-like methyltransferase
LSAGETVFVVTAVTVVRAYDVPFVPAPEPVLREMLRLAEIGPQDVVYNLGSGDGRIVIMAAREFGHAAWASTSIPSTSRRHGTTRARLASRTG